MKIGQPVRGIWRYFKINELSLKFIYLGKIFEFFKIKLS